MAFNKKEVMRQNTAAIREIFTSIKERRNPKEAVLRRYRAYGGIKEILLDPNDLSNWTKTDLLLEKEVKELHDVISAFFKSEPQRGNNMLDSLRASVLTSFYTPEDLIKSFVNPIAEKYKGVKNLQVFEPAAGKGDIVDVIKDSLPKANIHAVEKEALAYYFIKKLHPDIEGNIHYSGLEKTGDKFSPSSMDLVISNIPFGNIKVYDPAFAKSDDQYLQKSQGAIHQYFFAKGMYLLKPGGTMAFITSTGIMDSTKGAYLRERLMLESELVDAYRLPAETFMDFSGTEVTSDLIVLKKRNESLKSLEELNDQERLFIETGDFSGRFTVNKYYLENRSKVLGGFEVGYMHSRESLIVKIGKGDMSGYKNLDQVYKALNKGLKSSIDSKYDRVEALGVEVDKDVPQLSLFETAPEERVRIKPINQEYFKDLTVGTIVLAHGSPARLNVRAGEYYTEPIDLVVDSGKLLALTALERSSIEHGKKNTDQSRERLLATYNQFVSEYGYLNSKENSELLDLHPLRARFLAYEVKNGLEWSPSDTLVKDISEKKEVDQLDELSDALMKSLNEKGAVDVKYMADLMSISEDELIKKGINEQLVYPSPVFSSDFDYVNTDSSSYGKENGFTYVTRDELLSGPVRYKREWFENYDGAKALLGGSDDELVNTVKMLREVEPPILDYKVIDVRLGEPWIDKGVFEDFARELFEVSSVKIDKLESTGKWNVQLSGYSSVSSDYFRIHTKGGRYVYGKDLLIHALSGGEPNYTYSVEDGHGNKIKKVDYAANDIARERILEINQRFQDFLSTRPELTNYLERKYYALYNKEVLREYDGSHISFKYLEFYELRKHQKNAVWQIVSQNGGVADHKVGAGKTLEMVCAAVKLKELALANKPMIIAKNANVKEVYKTFMKAFPNAKVLSPTDAEFQKKNREVLFERIASNDWDCVVLSHDQFKKIEQSPEIQRKLIQEELDNINRDLMAMTEDRGYGASKRELKGLETRRANLEARLNRLSDLNYDKVVSFDKMGIDHLMVDESQVYKNLAFTTRHSRVAGLGNPEGSQAAFNLLIAARTLQEKHGGDKGLSFYSGTTISNSIVELYSIFKYHIPNKLETLGIKSFDEWARVFAELSSEYEIGVTGEVKSKKRFRAFIKVPELAKLYASFTNVVNDHNLEIDKPELERINVEIEPTFEQEAFMKELVNAVKSDNFSGLGLDYSENQLAAKMLIATGLANKCSMDMRLLDPVMYDETSGGKLPTVGATIFKHYKESDEHKGTQIVFNDIGVPYTESAKKTISTYHELRKILVENYNIPEGEIAFAHDYKTKPQKSILYEKVNKGEVRVVLGSTDKLGVGVNAQERVVAMHNLDMPWKPDELEQRDGRGARYGNWLAKERFDNKVKSYIYCTKGSLDAYKYYLINLKQRFIDQVKNASVSQRRIDEGDMDGESMSMANFIARISGKEEVIEKSKVDKQLDELTRKRDAFNMEKARAKNELDYLENSCKLNTTHLQSLKEDRILRNSLTQFSDKDNVKIELMIDGKLETDAKRIGGLLQQKAMRIAKSPDKHVPHELAELGGFKLYGMKTDNGRDGLHSVTVKVKRPESTISYSIGSSMLSEVQGTSARYFHECLLRIEGLEKKTAATIEEDKATIEQLHKKLDSMKDKNFDSEIEGLKKRSAELQKIIEDDVRGGDKDEGDKDKGKNENKGLDNGSGVQEDAVEYKRKTGGMSI